MIKSTPKYVGVALIIMIFSTAANEALGQGRGKIIGFKSGLYEDEQRDWIVLEVKPNSFDAYKNEPKSNYEVHGVLICYEYNGNPKAVRQDMTPKIRENGKYTYTLAYTTSARVRNVEVQTFDATKSRSTYPKKSSCF